METEPNPLITKMVAGAAGLPSAPIKKEEFLAICELIDSARKVEEILAFTECGRSAQRDNAD